MEKNILGASRLVETICPRTHIPSICIWKEIWQREYNCMISEEKNYSMETSLNN